jgi:hypothetical protein
MYYPGEPNSHATYKKPPHEKIIEEENNRGLINIQIPKHLSASLKNRPVEKFAGIYLPSCQWYLFSR